MELISIDGGGGRITSTAEGIAARAWLRRAVTFSRIGRVRSLLSGVSGVGGSVANALARAGSICGIGLLHGRIAGLRARIPDVSRLLRAHHRNSGKEVAA